MKNYYNILGIDALASNEDIKKITKKLITDIKASKLSSTEMKKKLKELEEAYSYLNDYHKRKLLDNYLENNSLDLLNQNAFTDAFSVFNNVNSIFNNFSKNDFNISDNNKINSFYQKNSYVSTVNKDGKIVTDEKIITNNNGDKKESHRIITKDKDGNEIIKEVPQKNKKSIKYNI